MYLLNWGFMSIKKKEKKEILIYSTKTYQIQDFFYNFYIIDFLFSL